MIKNLIDLFENSRKMGETESNPHNNSLELAAAVLMLEISMADSNFDDQERQQIKSILSTRFNIQQDSLNELIDLAEHEVDHAVSLHSFTRTINDTLTEKERTEIVEMLWRVAYADSVLDKYEEYFIRKIADLLYVSHKDYIKAKHKASA